MQNPWPVRCYHAIHPRVKEGLSVRFSFNEQVVPGCSSPLKVHLQLSMAAKSAKINGLLMDFCIGTSGVDFFLDVICLDFIARQRWDSPFWGVENEISVFSIGFASGFLSKAWMIHWLEMFMNYSASETFKPETRCTNHPARFWRTLFMIWEQLPSRFLQKSPWLVIFDTKMIILMFQMGTELKVPL